MIPWPDTQPCPTCNGTGTVVYYGSGVVVVTGGPSSPTLPLALANAFDLADLILDPPVVRVVAPPPPTVWRARSPALRQRARRPQRRLLRRGGNWGRHHSSWHRKYG